MLYTMILFCLSLAWADRVAESTQPTLLVDKENRPLPDDPNNPAVGWRKVLPAEAKAWSAVGQLIADGSPRCTTTIIKPPNCKDPKKQKAHIITNGHCTARVSDGFKVKFGVIDGIADADRSEISAKPIYSTQNHYDLAVLELDQNYESLAQFGVSATEIAPSLKTGEKVKNVAIPLNKIVKDQQVMRINESCVPDKPVTIIDQFRFFDHQVTLESCSLIGGSSGSGLFNESGQLAGLANAGVNGELPANSSHACEMDTCVYDGKSTPQRQMHNFGFDISFLHQCYKDCQLDTTLPDCPLPDPGRDLASFGFRNNNWSSDLNQKLPVLSKMFKNYQVKGCVPATDCSCQDPSGYQTMKEDAGKLDMNGYYQTSVSPAHYLPKGTKLVAKEGDPATFQFLCLRGQLPDGSWDKPKNATAFPIYLYRKKAPSLFK